MPRTVSPAWRHPDQRQTILCLESQIGMHEARLPFVVEKSLRSGQGQGRLPGSAGLSVAVPPPVHHALLLEKLPLKKMSGGSSVTRAQGRAVQRWPVHHALPRVLASWLRSTAMSSPFPSRPLGRRVGRRAQGGSKRKQTKFGISRGNIPNASCEQGGRSVPGCWRSAGGGRAWPPAPRAQPRRPPPRPARSRPRCSS